MITEPGIYQISAADYHADNFLPEPSLSSSIAKLLVTPGTTPLHAWTKSARLNPDHEDDEEKKFDLGKAAHALMLRDLSQGIEIIDAANWNKDIDKAKRAAARAADKIPLLTDQFERATEMVIAARKQLDVHEEGHGFFVDGRPEMVMVWREDGVLCRARVDWQPNSGIFWPDYKSTAASADPDSWQRTAYGMGADIQAAFYLRGFRALGFDKAQFRFAVQENYKPFALSVIGLMPGAIDLADRKVERALAVWRECRRTNTWPAYPRRTAWIDAPAYHEAAVLNREVRDAEAAGTRSAIDWG